MPGSAGKYRVKSRPIFAWVYERLARSMEKGPVGKYRRELLAPLSGRVIEIGAGTGENIKHYSPLVTRVVVTEPDRFMLRRAKHQDATPAPPIDFVRAAGERLPFADSSFDAAVATLVLCSVSDQSVVLAEIRRVLRPGASLYFLEHVRDESSAKIARRQDRWAGIWSSVGAGCHPNRTTANALADGGFAISEITEFQMSGAPRMVRPHILGEARKP